MKKLFIFISSIVLALSCLFSTGLVYADETTQEYYFQGSNYINIGGDVRGYNYVSGISREDYLGFVNIRALVYQNQGSVDVELESYCIPINHGMYDENIVYTKLMLGNYNDLITNDNLTIINDIYEFSYSTNTTNIQYFSLFFPRSQLGDYAEWECFNGAFVVTQNDDYFDANIVSVEFGNSENISNLSFTRYNYMRYTCQNGCSLTICIDISNAVNMDSNTDDFMLDYRKYYLENAFDTQYDLGYQYGFTNGRNRGYELGYSTGYSEGSATGEIIGYNNGKNDGMSIGSTYTFPYLLGSVFDVPIKTINGLLDFNFLGINMLQFALSLLTFSLVIWLLRLILGGKE